MLWTKAGETARSLKYLLCKYKDRSSIPTTCIKILSISTVEHTWNPSAGEGEIGSRSCLIGDLQDSEPHLKEGGWHFWGWPLHTCHLCIWPPHIFLHTHTHTHGCAHTSRKKSLKSCRWKNFWWHDKMINSSKNSSDRVFRMKDPVQADPPKMSRIQNS